MVGFVTVALNMQKQKWMSGEPVVSEEIHGKKKKLENQYFTVLSLFTEKIYYFMLTSFIHSFYFFG